MKKPRNSRPTKSEHDGIILFLKGKGFTSPWIKKNLGLTYANRSRKRIEKKLRAGLKGLPKR